MAERPRACPLSPACAGAAIPHSDQKSLRPGGRIQSNSVVDVALLEHVLRQDLEERAQRAWL